MFYPRSPTAASAFVIALVRHPTVGRLKFIREAVSFTLCYYYVSFDGMWLLRVS
jgi:hypothetical protein